MGLGGHNATILIQAPPGVATVVVAGQAMTAEEYIPRRMR
jgi:hypothetical protein